MPEGYALIIMQREETSSREVNTWPEPNFRDPKRRQTRSAMRYQVYYADRAAADSQPIFQGWQIHGVTWAPFGKPKIQHAARTHVLVHQIPCASPYLQ